MASKAVLGDILTALNRKSEARDAYEQALDSARTMHPEFQIGWISHLQKSWLS